MTKRAGKNKNRKPGQQQPSFAPSKPNTLVEDHLKPSESLALEMRALREGWLCQNETFNETRQALLTKVALAGISATDPNVMIKALNSLSRAEQRHVALMIQVTRSQNRSKDLPQQVQTVAVNVSPERPKTHEVIAELIAKREVRAAVNNRPLVTAITGSVGGSEVSASGSPGAA